LLAVGGNESSLETGLGREHSITDAERWWSRGRGELAAGRDEAWSGIPSGHFRGDDLLRFFTV
jgi:hypothetical protein